MKYNRNNMPGERISNFLHAALAVPFGLLATAGITLHMLVLLG